MISRDLGFAFFGNGLTVYDRLHENDGDYEKVAHIATDRTVSYYCELSEADKAAIKKIAKESDPFTSTSQVNKVFRDRPVDLALSK